MTLIDVCRLRISSESVDQELVLKTALFRSAGNVSVADLKFSQRKSVYCRIIIRVGWKVRNR